MADVRQRCGARMNEGVAQLDQGDLGQAIRILRQAIQIDPDYHLPWLNLGLAYKRSRRWAEALDAFLTARAKAPGDIAAETYASILWNIGITATAVANWAEAAQAWRSLGHSVGTHRDQSPSVPMGEAWIQRGSFAPALGERIDPARIRVVEDRFNETGLRMNAVLVHDAARIGVKRHQGADLPVFAEL